MKFYLSILCLLTGAFHASADDVFNHVPKNSNFVITINVSALNSKMKLSDMDTLKVFRNILRESLSSASDSTDIKLEDLGVDLNGKFTFFMESTDSAHFMTLLVPLKDAQKFLQYQEAKNKFLDKPLEFKENKLGYYEKENYSSLLSWNTKYAIFVQGDLSDEYKKRFDYSDVSSLVIDTAASYEENYSDFSTTPIDDSVNIKYHDDYYYEGSYHTPDSVGPGEQDVYIESSNDSYNYYDKISEARHRMQRSYVYYLMDLPVTKSISSDARFIKSQDNESPLTFWVGTRKELILQSLRQYLGSYYYKFELPVGSPVFSEENYTISKLKFNQDDIRIETEAHIDDRLVKHYKKISDASVNKKFFKYIKADTLFGYMSSAVNVRASLEESPKLWKYYLDMFPYTHDISSELMDLMFLFVDEKAIGKLFKGDFLLAFTGVAEKEMEYVSYEYDSLFVMQEVMHKKMQRYPEFISMYSTGDMENTKKFFTILCRKNLLKDKNGYYTTDLFGKSPFSLYFVIQKGIVYLCNSEAQLNIILKGGNRSPISSAHKKLIRKNSFSMFVDIQKVLQSFADPADPVMNPMLAMGIENSRQMYFYAGKVTSSTMYSELKLIKPTSKYNSLEFTMNLLNEIYKLDQEEKLRTATPPTEEPEEKY